ncbi:hypothetical protein D3C87_573810 [compost metagenome]
MEAFTEPGKRVREFLDIFLIGKSLTSDEITINSSVDKANKISITEVSMPRGLIYKFSVYMKEDKKAIITGTVKFAIDFMMDSKIDIHESFEKSSLLVVKSLSDEIIISFSTVKDLKKIFNIVKQII